MLSCGNVNRGSGPTGYGVVEAESHLRLLNRKKNGAECSFFHHHAVAARNVTYAFNLDVNNPAGSTLSAEVLVVGLDVDDPAERARYDETRDSNFTERERGDIRASMMQQLDEVNHPLITFAAAGMSLLDGPRTELVNVTLRGVTSTIPLAVTVVNSGDRITVEGTGSLDTAPHGMPVGALRDCIDAVMPLSLKMVLAPGGGDGCNRDGGMGTRGDAAVQLFPEPAGSCALPSDGGPLSFLAVRQLLQLKCAGCHSNPPVFGASVPLVDFEDWRRDSPLAPGVPLYDNAKERLEASAGLRVMPPAGYDLTSSERARLLRWLNSGALQLPCDADGRPTRPRTFPDAGCEVRQPDEHPYEKVCTFVVKSMNKGRDCLACHGERQAVERYQLCPELEFITPPAADDAGICRVDERIYGRNDNGTCQFPPFYTLAGTVFGTLHEGDFCLGVKDVTVRITDVDGGGVTPDGGVLDLPTTGESLGNFWTTIPVKTPYRAELRITDTAGNTVVRRMMTAQTETSCNRCHTPFGTALWDGGPPAPQGRVVAPVP